MIDDLAEYNEWCIQHQDMILELWEQEIDKTDNFPEYIYEGVLDDDYQEAEEGRFESEGKRHRTAEEEGPQKGKGEEERRKIRQDPKERYLDENREGSQKEAEGAEGERADRSANLRQDVQEGQGRRVQEQEAHALLPQGKQASERQQEGCLA